MLLPLLPIAAAAAGAARIGIGAHQNRKEAKRQRRLIQEAYGNASERMATRQGDIRQGHEESLVARGLAGGGQATNTIAGGARTGLEKEFGLERQDLDWQLKKGYSDIKARGQQQAISDISAGIGTGMDVYSIGSAMRSAAPPSTGDYGTSSMPGGMFGPVRTGGSLIGSAMTGSDDAGNWFGDVIGTNPLRAPGSSWNRRGTQVGDGQPNVNFNVVG